jgi:hypothetical protein
VEASIKTRRYPPPKHSVSKTVDAEEGHRGSANRKAKRTIVRIPYNASYTWKLKITLEVWNPPGLLQSMQHVLFVYISDPAAVEGVEAVNSKPTQTLQRQT